MTDFRSCFSGAALKISLYSLFFLLLLSPGLSGKDRSKTKTAPKTSLVKKSIQKKTSKAKPLKIKSSKKNSSKKEITKNKSSVKKPLVKSTSSKDAARKITVVMENYPPNCYIDNPPKVISEDKFRNSVLKKVKEKKQRDFLLSVYQFNRTSGKYSLAANADKASLEKLKDILFQAGFLNVTGFEVEISKSVFASIGIDPVYKVYPWARCIEMMKSGTSDVILTIFKNSERMKYLYYPSEFTIVEPNVLFKLKGSDITFDGDLKKLKKYVVGVKSSTSYGEKFDRASYIRKEEVPFTESVISLVENKRVSLGVGSVTLLKYLMGQKGITDKFTLLKPAVSQENLYIAFSKAGKQKQLSEKFSEKLTKFKKTDKYKKIMKKYGLVNS